MDISGLTAGYDQYAEALNVKEQAAANKLSALKDRDMSKATDDELMEVCKEFEAYFMEMVMKEMLKTVDQEDESNSMVDYFMDSAISDVAKKSTEQGQLGLAQQLYEQMKRNYAVE